MLKWLRKQRAWHREHLEAWQGQGSPGPDGLSPFQAFCEARLRGFLASRGFELRDRKVMLMNGAPEQYVQSSIGESRWRLLVYLDGLEVSDASSRALLRLEEWDALTPEELVTKACDALSRAIERGALSARPA